MLQWDSESIRAGDPFEQPGSDAYCYMFPNSAYASVDIPPLGTLPSQSHGSHSHTQPQQFHYDHVEDTAQYQSYSAPPPFSPQPMCATQVCQPPATQSEYFNMAPQDYTASSSTASLPTSPIPAPTTTFTEPQIRLNSNMFRHDHGRYVAMPLDPRQVGRYVYATTVTRLADR